MASGCLMHVIKYKKNKLAGNLALSAFSKLTTVQNNRFETWKEQKDSCLA